MATFPEVTQVEPLPLQPGGRARGPAEDAGDKTVQVGGGDPGSQVPEGQGGFTRASPGILGPT